MKEEVGGRGSREETYRRPNAKELFLGCSKTQKRRNKREMARRTLKRSNVCDV